MEAYEIPVKEKRGDRGGLLSVYFVHFRLANVFRRARRLFLCMISPLYDSVASLAFCIAGGGMALLSLTSFWTPVFWLRCFLRIPLVCGR